MKRKSKCEFDKTAGALGPRPEPRYCRSLLFFHRVAFNFSSDFVNIIFASFVLKNSLILSRSFA